MFEVPFHEAFVSDQIYQPLALACPSVRATLVKIPSGGNDDVKKFDRGLDGKGKRRQLVDGRVFGGNQVFGQRNELLWTALKRAMERSERSSLSACAISAVEWFLMPLVIRRHREGGRVL